jgi:hypothetical protein
LEASEEGLTMPDENPPHRVPIDPPPPPPLFMMIGFALTFVAAVAGFLGFCFIAGVLALLGFVFGVTNHLRTRGYVEIPQSAIDSEGRLKGFKRTG